jgi:uncharacterized membrane protein YbhN (UPF0104 family)
MKGIWSSVPQGLRLLPVAVTLGLLALLLMSCDWEKVAEISRNIDVAYAALALIVLVLGIATGSVALWILFGSAHRFVWLGQFTLDYFYVQSLCQFTPAQAAEAALPYIAGRGRFAPGEILAGLVIQRMTSLGVVLAFTVIGAGKVTSRSTLLIAVTVTLSICLAVTGLITNGRTRGWLNELVGRRFGPVASGFYDTWVDVFHRGRGRLLIHIVLMVTRFVAGVGATFAMFLAFGIAVPFWVLSALLAVATLASSFPISVNGIGVSEGIFVTALANYGYGTEQVLGASLAARLLVIATFSVFSVAYWHWRKASKESTRISKN